MNQFADFTNRPNGVLKVQSLALSLSSSTCQNSELAMASSPEKYLAFVLFLQ